MNCIITKRNKLTEKDYDRIVEALTQVRCCKCGYTIEVMSLAYATTHFDKKRYENRVCDKCKEESEGEG